MSIAFPSVKVEVKFSSGPDWGEAVLGSFVLGVSGLGDPSAVFSDISADVRRVSINRGKNRELEEFRSGTAMVFLSNNSRQYDPTFTTGPYYPDVKPGRMVKISVTHPTTAVEYLVYKGVIRSWGYQYITAGPNKGDSVAVISASDILYDISNAEFSTTTSAGLSGQQITSVLDQINISDRVIDSGIHSMQATTYENKNALTGLQDISYSEGVDVATVFGNSANQLVYEDAVALEVKSNKGTFGPSALPLTDVSLTYESDLIKNSVAFAWVYCFLTFPWTHITAHAQSSTTCENRYNTQKIPEESEGNHRIEARSKQTR